MVRHRDMRAALPEIINALLSPAAYDHDAADIWLVQTHISYVVLSGGFAYKVRKPIDLGFVDYSTLEKRRQMCEEEVRLNRRGCEDVYLGVVPIVLESGRYRVAADGAAVEYAVKMNRISDEQVMAHRLARGVVSVEDVRRLARAVAAFHRQSETNAYIQR